MAKLRNCLDTISVYVSTYKKYNEGSLFGKWIKLSDYVDYDDFLKAIKELHKDEEDPEFMFQDYECPNFIETLGLISESYLSKEIYNITNLISDLNYDYEVWDSFFDCFGTMDLNDAKSRINDCYYGRFDSDIEFVQYLLEETGDLPENLPFYIHIDWEATARDIMMDFSTSENHYFRNY